VVATPADHPLNLSAGAVLPAKTRFLRTLIHIDFQQTVGDLLLVVVCLGGIGELRAIGLVFNLVVHADGSGRWLFTVKRSGGCVGRPGKRWVPRYTSKNARAESGRSAKPSLSAVMLGFEAVTLFTRLEQDSWSMTTLDAPG
jgi:hypothetical protein